MFLPFNLLKLEKMIKLFKVKAVTFGEVLWDVFPTHKKIGGAPLNVALRMKSFGAESTIISKIGSDVDGKEIVSFLSEKGIDTDIIQISEEYKTGVVNVMINDKGN